MKALEELVAGILYGLLCVLCIMFAGILGMVAAILKTAIGS